jgi:hypothetical protein
VQPGASCAFGFAEVRARLPEPPARVPQLVAADMLALARRCRGALPVLRRRVAAARADLQAGIAEPWVLRAALRDAVEDLRLAQQGAVEARAWAAELTGAGARR